MATLLAVACSATVAIFTASASALSACSASATFCSARLTALRYWAAASSRAARAARSLCSRAPPPNRGWEVDSGSNAPKSGPGCGHPLRTNRDAARIRRDFDIREPIGGGNAHLRAGGMKVRLGRAHVRTLLDQPKREADGKFLRQMKPGQRKSFDRWLTWDVPPERAAREKSRCCSSCFCSGGSACCAWARAASWARTSTTAMAPSSCSRRITCSSSLSTRTTSTRRELGHAGRLPARRRRRHWRSVSGRSPRSGNAGFPLGPGPTRPSARVSPNTSGTNEAVTCPV